MGQKTNPIGNRLGIIRGWDSNWYGGRNYGDKIAEDDKLKLYNWCGIYCTQDVYTTPSLGTGTRYVNYFGIKNSNQLYLAKAVDLAYRQSA